MSAGKYPSIFSPQLHLEQTHFLSSIWHSKNDVLVKSDKDRRDQR